MLLMLFLSKIRKAMLVLLLAQVKKAVADASTLVTRSMSAVRNSKPRLTLILAQTDPRLVTLKALLSCSVTTARPKVT